MARKIGFCVYRLQIKNKNAAAWWRFQHGSATDAYTELHTYLRARRNTLVRLGFQDPETESYADNRAVKLVRLVQNENARMLAGIFLKGEAGVVQQIHNFDLPDADPVYTTSANEGALSPLYFRLYLEDARSFGIALLQTIGVEGLKGFVQQDLTHYFSELPQPRTARLTQLVDAAVLNAFAQQGRLQNVVLVNSGESQESRDEMQRTSVNDNHLGQDGDKLNLTLHRRGGWPQNIIRNLLAAVRGERDPRELISVPGMESYDDLLVDVEQGGRTQRFSLLNPDDSPLRYDITDQVVNGPDGFPTWASLQAAADNIWTSVQAII